MTANEAGQLCQKVVTQIGEQFEEPSVQILVNWKDENGNWNFTWGGSGSIQARMGMCQEIIDMHKADLAMIAKERREAEQRRRDGLQ